MLHPTNHSTHDIITPTKAAKDRPLPAISKSVTALCSAKWALCGTLHPPRQTANVEKVPTTKSVEQLTLLVALEADSATLLFGLVEADLWQRMNLIV
mmetsp:Transcript_2251/g.6439  ORF Transcript_2251/g.6439 Transcript_2251/m.6439 type:complete len:97 (+) Transcript_2251:366-656(+)